MNFSKRERTLITCLVVVVVLFVIVYFQPFSAKSTSKDSENLSWEEAKKKKSPQKKKTLSAPEFYLVDVKGAVKAPGVYKMTNGDRIIDVIEKAGGFLQKANQKQINLAERLKDEMVIYVPKVGEKAEGLTDNQDDGKVSVNHGGVSELATLSGIGPAKAEAIISYRKKHGDFKEFENLLNVPGIGESTLSNIKEVVTLD